MLVDDAYRTLTGDAFFEWLLRASTWATEGLMPRPAPGTVLAEAPPFTMDHVAQHTFVLTNDEATPWSVDLEHRTSNNQGNVRSQRVVVPARATMTVNWSLMVRMSERFRAVSR